MAFLWNLLNDTLCQEDSQPKRFQQYNPEFGNSRQNYPPGTRLPNHGNMMASPGSKAGQNGHQMAMSEQYGSGEEWSRSPPQQRGNGARNPAASPAQARTRGLGAQSEQGWSSRSPQGGNSNRQQPQNGANGPPNGQARYSQDEMNPRDAGWSRMPDGRDEMNLREGSSPRRQQPNQQANSQQAPSERSQAPRQQGAPGAGAGAPANKAQARQQQQRRRQQQTRDESDTIIGKGFTAAMKRGVAQAKPISPHEELVAQKDGGFISTIQRGFEGLFGKPTSKEEVLRKRGAVWANEYEAVPGDEIDQRVQFFARRLPEDVAGCLKIFRQAKGEYKINDEMVNMELRYRQNPQGQTEKDIFAFWTTEEGEQSDPEPLGLYLSHAANVAFEVKQGGNVITQVPDHARMSFHDEIGTKLTDGSADARFNAMEVAARQAKMREEAAMEWREKQNKPKDEEDGAPQGQKAEEPQKLKDRPVSAEGNVIDDALQAIGFMQSPPVPNAAAHQPVPSMAAPAASSAPAGFPPMPPQVAGLYPPDGISMPMGGQGTFYGVGQAGVNMPMGGQGTFYGVGQAGQGTFYGIGQVPQVPRQGTMYAYGSAQSPGMMAAAYPGYAAPAPMQRQGTMYAYGSAVPVPVR